MSIIVIREGYTRICVEMEPVLSKLVSDPMMMVMTPFEVKWRKGSWSDPVWTEGFLFLFYDI